MFQLIHLNYFPEIHEQLEGPTEISSLPKKKLAVRIVEEFPTGVQPYLRIARLDRPIGTQIKKKMFPCS